MSILEPESLTREIERAMQQGDQQAFDELMAIRQERSPLGQLKSMIEAMGLTSPEHEMAVQGDYNTRVPGSTGYAHATQRGGQPLIPTVESIQRDPEMVRAWLKAQGQPGGASDQPGAASQPGGPDTPTPIPDPVDDESEEEKRHRLFTRGLQTMFTIDAEVKARGWHPKWEGAKRAEYAEDLLEDGIPPNLIAAWVEGGSRGVFAATQGQGQGGGDDVANRQQVNAVLSEMHRELRKATEDYEGEPNIGAAQRLEDRTGANVVKGSLWWKQIDPAAGMRGMLETDPRYKILQGLPAMEGLMQQIQAQQDLRDAYARKKALQNK